MKGNSYEEYFNYYLELERDFLLTEPYVTIDEDNFNTFSINYNRIYQSICSEIDSLLKDVCRQCDSTVAANNIKQYCNIIQRSFSKFNEEVVCFNKSRIEVQPWNDWTVDKSPVWWSNYNKVKHQRMEIDSITNKPYYQQANLENVLNALGALYIVEQYFIYSYDFSDTDETQKRFSNNQLTKEESISKSMENALIRNQSKNCYMKRWMTAGCYTEFMGQDFFEIKNLKKIMK